MPFYVFGAYGRAIMAGLIALLLWFGGGMAPTLLGVAFLGLWTLYAFVSGVVAVPYNDIVGRAGLRTTRPRYMGLRVNRKGPPVTSLLLVSEVELTWVPSRRNSTKAQTGAMKLTAMSPIPMERLCT